MAKTETIAAATIFNLALQTTLFNKSKQKTAIIGCFLIFFIVKLF